MAKKEIEGKKEIDGQKDRCNSNEKHYNLQFIGLNWTFPNRTRGRLPPSLKIIFQIPQNTCYFIVNKKLFI